MGQQSVVSISVGGIDLYVASDRVREILGSIPIVALPGGPRGLVGITTWASRVIAVFDLSVLVGVAANEPRPRTIVVEGADARLALPVESVREPRTVDRSRPAHATRTSFADVEVEAAGVFGPLLDVDAIVRGFPRGDA